MTAGEPARHSGDRPPQALPRAFFARPAPEVAAELYAASLLAMAPDAPEERAFLTRLQTALHLDPALARQIEHAVQAAEMA